ncbi:DUF397 domain-containing protein [Streptomyces sp. LX-29]|uniref:DUF397 domain-containing protein n=1 Tax=Streptomyces sp. LX-29 TaxID=2900152 RepID=UPI00240E6D78|nr:DUF397 domain-containing protein [Streptomyces sp. LX-29]WFB10370.1 DUF397 domain-containing protein [Streptomyces sp. LX-29]
MTTKAHTPAAQDLTDADWFKSSYSSNGQNCVEVATPSMSADGGMAVRDSKDPSGPALVFSARGWSSFVAAIKRGEFPAV